MNQNEVRRGMSQAKTNEHGASLYGLEVIVISVVLGFLTQSWIVFVLLLIGLIAGINIKNFVIGISILLTIMWILIGWKIGATFGSVSASVVLSILFALISIGVHASAFDWNRDIHER